MKKYVKPETKFVDYTTDSIMLDYSNPDCADVTTALSSSGLPTGQTVTFTVTVDGASSHAHVTLPAGKEYRIKTVNGSEVAKWHTCSQTQWEGYGECEAEISSTYKNNFIEVKNTAGRWVAFTDYQWKKWVSSGYNRGYWTNE